MVKIIRNIKELQEIESEWTALFNLSPNQNVFMSYDWNYLWVKYFAGTNKLFIIAVYNDLGELEAIAPFFLKRFFLFFTSLMFISYDYSDYLDIIVGKNTDKEKIYSEIFNAVIKNKVANIIHLKQISEELLDGIKKSMQGIRHLAIKYKESGNCYYFNLPAGIDEYMKRFKSKQRYNILSRVEKAEKRGVRFLSSYCIDKVSFDLCLNYFLDLHQKRWNEKGKKGVFYNRKIRGFFTDLFNELYNKNKLSLSFLIADNTASGTFVQGKCDNEGGALNVRGDIISSAICFDCGNKRQVYLPGFDTKYSNYHPGIVLTYYIIKEAIDKKYEEFDFLKGSEDYKQRFLAVKRENYKLYIFNNKIIFYIYKINLFIKKEIKEKLKDLIFRFKGNLL